MASLDMNHGNYYSQNFTLYERIFAFAGVTFASLVVALGLSFILSTMFFYFNFDEVRRYNPSMLEVLNFKILAVAFIFIFLFHWKFQRKIMFLQKVRAVLLQLGELKTIDPAYLERQSTEDKIRYVGFLAANVRLENETKNLWQQFTEHFKIPLFSLGFRRMNEEIDDLKDLIESYNLAKRVTAHNKDIKYWNSELAR